MSLVSSPVAVEGMNRLAGTGMRCTKETAGVPEARVSTAFLPGVRPSARSFFGLAKTWSR